jgi:hypothetical protein
MKNIDSNNKIKINKKILTKLLLIFIFILIIKIYNNNNLIINLDMNSPKSNQLFSLMKKRKN